MADFIQVGFIWGYSSARGSVVRSVTHTLLYVLLFIITNRNCLIIKAMALFWLLIMALKAPGD